MSIADEAFEETKEFSVNVTHKSIGLSIKCVTHLAEECYSTGELNLYNGTIDYAFNDKENATVFASIITSHLKIKKGKLY